MAQKRAAGRSEERRRGREKQNPDGRLEKRAENRDNRMGECREKASSRPLKLAKTTDFKKGAKSEKRIDRGNVAERTSHPRIPVTPGPRAQWKPGNMIYPVPAVLVTVGDSKGNSNIITIAWTGTICTNPPMAYISVRPERYSYHMLRESGEFVINLATESMAYATDYCGVRSGRDVDKWKETGLTPVPAQTVKAPVIAESPVAIECRVTEVKELGSHHMFLAEVTGVSVDEQWLNERGTLELAKANPIVYSHGGYYGLSKLLGTFGWSVKKKRGAKDEK